MIFDFLMILTIVFIIKSPANSPAFLISSFGMLVSFSLAIEIIVSLKIYHFSFLLIDKLLIKLWLMSLLRLIVDFHLKLCFWCRPNTLSLKWIINCNKASAINLFDHSIIVQVLTKWSISFFLLVYLLLLLGWFDLEMLKFCKLISNLLLFSFLFQSLLLSLSFCLSSNSWCLHQMSTDALRN